METIFLLTLRHKKAGVLMLETVKEQFLVFGKEESMKTWLCNNGFVYGHCGDFANISGKFYWFHQKDTPMDMVEVEINELAVNDDSLEAEEWIKGLMFRRYRGANGLL